MCITSCVGYETPASEAVKGCSSPPVGTCLRSGAKKAREERGGPTAEDAEEKIRSFGVLSGLRVNQNLEVGLSIHQEVMSR